MQKWMMKYQALNEDKIVPLLNICTVRNRANIKAGSHKIPLLESEICAGNVFSKSI